MTDWAQIVRQHELIVWNTAYRLLGNEADAADCFQETFIAALNVAGRERIENWPGLLQKIATVQALQLLRKRRRITARLEPLDDDADPPALAAGPHAHRLSALQWVR